MDYFVLNEQSSCNWQDKESALILEKTMLSLTHGGVILVPTDTVYGLAVSPIFGDAIKKIYSLKRRPQHAPLPIVIADKNQLNELGLLLSEHANMLISSRYMPGALSLILPVCFSKAPSWLSERKEVAVRIPDNDFLRCLIRKSGPLLMTSANQHGKDTPNNVKAILDQLSGCPDCVIDGGFIDTIPSTIVNCVDKEAVIERIGVVPHNTIERILYGTK